MVAGGSLSPLLGALYLAPLDQATEKLVASGKIFYVRYMDDFVLLARTRWHLREAISSVYRVMKELKLHLHREKRFVGKTLVLHSWDIACTRGASFVPSPKECAG